MSAFSQKMNSTMFNDSIRTTVESWFVPFDIIMIVSAIFVIFMALIFLVIIILDKTCHTVPIMLIANSCLTELLLGSDMCAIALFTLQNDIKQIQYQDSLCIIRSYLSFTTFALQNYSYLLLSIYRYIIVVYPTRLVWQSIRTQLFFIILTWIVAFGNAAPFLFTGDIVYDSDNQSCQISLRFSFPIVYGSICAYMIPIMLVMFVYMKLVRHVKGMAKRIIPSNTLIRAERDLKMVRRIVILVSTVTAIGIPYSIITFLAFFNRAPRYHFRIAYIFVDISMVFVMIALFQITDPIKTYIKKRINYRHQPNVIIAITA